MSFLDDQFWKDVGDTTLEKLGVSTGTQTVDTAGKVLKSITKKPEAEPSRVVAAAEESAGVNRAFTDQQKKILLLTGAAIAAWIIFGG